MAELNKVSRAQYHFQLRAWRAMAIQPEYTHAGIVERRAILQELSFSIKGSKC